MSDFDLGRLHGMPSAPADVRRSAQPETGVVHTNVSALTLTLVDGSPAQPVETKRLKGQRWLKRGMDVTLSLLALILILPLLVAVSIAVKLTSKGPVLFYQQREGIGDSTFSIMKFRTMFRETEDVSGILQVTPNDGRVTPVGRLLRRTSIDELPQLLNVLKGDMSLVGPRPHVPGMLAAEVPYDRLVPHYHFRRKVLPGLTGWAQANGYRGSTKDSNMAVTRVLHDFAYIQNFSLLLDVKILLMTLRREFLRGSGD